MTDCAVPKHRQTIGDMVDVADPMTEKMDEKMEGQVVEAIDAKEPSASPELGTPGVPGDEEDAKNNVPYTLIPRC